MGTECESQAEELDQESESSHGRINETPPITAAQHHPEFNTIEHIFNRLHISSDTQQDRRTYKYKTNDIFTWRCY